MAIYEYQGLSYDIATDDPEEAKSKILAHLGTAETPEPAAAATSMAPEPGNPPAQPPEPAMGPVATVLGAVAPAGMYGATGIPEMAGRVAEAGQPFAQGVKNALSGYIKNPAQAVVDYGAVHLGLPPPYATGHTVKGLYETYKGAQQTAGNLLDAFSNLPAGTDKLAGPFVNELSAPERSALLKSANEVGIDRALKTFQPAASMSPEALQSLSAIKNAIPGPAQRIASAAGGIAGPLARGALKVLGPVGMAANLYDAGRMARDTQLGQRIAQGQAQQAQQAFRQINPQYGAAISPEQAQILSQSGSQRDIQAFGGSDQLNQLIRTAAAKKALAGF